MQNANKKLIKMIGRFSLASAVNTLFSLVSFQPVYFLFNSTLDEFSILLITHIFNVLFSFFLHRSFSFQVRSTMLSRLVKFMAYQTLIFFLAVNLIELFKIILNLPVYLAQPVATLFLITTNFFVYKSYIFKN